jgi:hypothetical protein
MHARSLVELAMLEQVAERRAGGLSLHRPAPVGRPEPPVVLTSDMVKVGSARVLDLYLQPVGR